MPVDHLGIEKENDKQELGFPGSCRDQESHLALDFKRLSNLTPRYSRSLRKNLLF
jgi:hypothetical protein